MMKKAWSAFLALMLLACAGWAEKADVVNAAVAQMGYTAMTSANRTRISGCWYTQDGPDETLQWSDAKSVYTVQARSDGGLKQAYGRIVSMAEWDTCTYTVNGKVLYAYNADELNAAHSYKTLKNYVQYVGEYIEEQVRENRPAATGYVVNTNTKRFHRPDCPSVEQIKPKNRQDSADSRLRLIEQGYSPCKQCNP